MSQDHGRHIHGRHLHQRPPHERPQAARELERPSLFAPVDGEADADDPDMQRVNILSTLESAWRAPRTAPSKARKQRTASSGEGSPWQIKLLMAIMGAGILSLLTAFALLVLDNGDLQGDAQQARSAQAAAPAAPRTRPIQADRHNPLAALMTQPSASSPPLEPAQQAAIIENLPVDPTAPVTTPVSAQPAAPEPSGLTLMAGAHSAANAHAGADTLAGMPSVSKAPGREAAAARPLLALAAPSAEHALAGGGRATTGHSATAAITLAPPAANKPPHKPSARPAKDDDVALLEAVLAHSAKRPAAAPATPAEELQRCTQLNDAAAATCRARICVRHPTTPACHQPP